MNAGAEREIRLGHVARPPTAIAVDIRNGALQLAMEADIWTQIPPKTTAAVSVAQGGVAGLARLLIDLRVAVNAQESRAA